jgi:MYXO-CTERM domain-containing protein
MKLTPLRAAAALALLLASPSARADGPGLPNLAYDPAEVFTVIGHLGAENGSPRGHGTLSLHRGYLTVIFSRDSGMGDGGFAFYDVADPRNPKLVFAKDDDETEDIREAHGYGYWGDYVVLQASYGVQFWDWSDVTKPKRVSYLKLPGISASDYFGGAWWAFWQAPYVYVGGSQSGLFILDATDVSNPKIVDRGADRPNPIPTPNLGGFRTGPVFAVGNTLVISGMDDPGYAVLDIRDPKNPLLLSAARLGMPKVYSALFNGGRLYGAGDDAHLHVHDVSDPFHIVSLGSSDSMGDKGGYLSVQDGFAHCGASKSYAKVDISGSTFSVVGSASSNVPGRDEDFGNVLGNLVAISDDHGNGSFLVPHQAAPDTTPPSVNFVSPPIGATGVARTSRIGLTFTDQIDKSHLDATTFFVRPVGGAAIPGRLSTQTNIVNFSPDTELLPNTTYEVVLPKGGLRDFAGNALPEAFISTFSTGTALDNPLCKVTTKGPVVRGSAASFSVSAQGSGLTFAWDFGDGSATTAPAASTSVDHVFSDPGHYTVNVFVRDAGGLLTTCSLGQTVHRPLTSAKPTRSTTLMIDDARSRVWVVNPDNGSVTSFDAPSLTRRFEAKVGAHPRAIAKAKDGSVWVAVERDARIAVLDQDDGHELASIPLPRGSRPFGLAFSPDGSRAYATLRGTGELVELDPAKRGVTRTLAVGPTPRGLAVTADGASVVVTRFLSPDEQGEVFEVDAASFTLARTFSLPIDTTPDTESAGSGLLNYLQSITISPDGAFAWVPAKKDNYLRGYYQSGKELTFENTVRSVVASLDLTTGEEQLSARLDFNDRSLPSAAALSPLGDYVFVATEGTNTVEVIDAYNPHLVGGVEKVGKAPDGLAIDGAGTTLYVHSFLSRSIHAIDISGLVAGTGTELAEKAKATTVEKEALAPEVLLGKQVFYDASDRRMSRDGYLSCAVCHLDGEHDGRTWDFTDRGEGLRNTTTLIGKRGAGQGRLHWTANFDEIQDFEHDIRNAFMGKGFLSDEVFHADGHDVSLGGKKAGLSPELDAIDAYLTSLTEVNPSPYRNQDGTFTDAARAGEAVFQKLECDGCHAGKDTTDSAKGELHDVGTLSLASGQRLGEPITGLDTPTLVGIWETGPYLHDGSAATLEAVLDKAIAAGDKHGAVGTLSPEERSQLVEYMLELDGTTPPEESPKESEEGCGCRVPGEGRDPHRGAPTAIVALAAMAVLRRRRDSARRTR